MSRGRKPEPDVPPTRGRRLLPALGLLLLAGCMEGLGHSDDPLLGGGPPIRRGNPQLGSSAGPSPGATAPPPPPGGPAPGTAALAAGTSPSQDPGQELRIGGTPVSSTASGAAVGGWAPATPAGQGGIQLHAPEPIQGNFSRLTPIPAGNPAVTLTSGNPVTTCPCPPPATPAAPETYEQLQYMLAIRGVTWQRLETRGDHGEWNFECTIPNRQQPGLQRHYSTTEPAATPQAAIRAVLDKIDREQNRTSG
jgi:hypothetical protein